MTFRRFGTKYGNKRTTHAGRSFDSRGEAGCFDYLKLLERAGEIEKLETQVTVEIVPGIRYRADFRFWDVKQSAWILGDFKGFENETWLIKKKLLKLFGHPYRVRVFKGRGLAMTVAEEIVPEPFNDVMEGMAAALEARGRFLEREEKGK